MASYYVSEIRAFAGTFAPENWLICNGATLQVNTYQALFAVIGNRYGGDAISNFMLPDLRGRLAVGQGAGTGLTPRVAGNVGGVETVIVAPTELPVHNHNLVASTVSTPASVNAPGAASYLGVVNSSLGSAVGYVPGDATGATVTELSTEVLLPAGSSQPHSNIMPFLALNYIICVNGIFPTQS